MRDRVQRRQKWRTNLGKPNTWIKILLPVLGVFLLGFITYHLPPVHDRLAPRVEEWQAEIFYWFNPPEAVVFMPGTDQEQQIESIVQATFSAMTPEAPTAALLPSATLKPGEPTPTLGPSLTPTITGTPLPASAQLSGVRYMDQHGVWNYCGPANLAMSLSYWGWGGNRYDTGTYLRGGVDREDDKNVMPYEMEDYVETQTDLEMVVRVGGDLNLLKTLLANDYVVLIEKGFFLEGIGWMGHYLTLTGYDEAAQEFISQDSYIGADTRIAYQEIYDVWRAFNFTFMVPYPPDQQAEVLDILGPWADEKWATRHALERAYQDAEELSGRDLYFAWFNIGTNHVDLLEYADAAFAYDFSFTLYANLPEDVRPWRMVWYQTGPYKAYYYTGRYGDVSQLATTTLDAMKDPIIEETYYWRGLAREALGDIDGAIDDLRTAVGLNPNFGTAWNQLERLGANQ
jgi:hypothetical protein